MESEGGRVTPFRQVRPKPQFLHHEPPLGSIDKAKGPREDQYMLPNIASGYEMELSFIGPHRLLDPFRRLAHFDNGTQFKDAYALLDEKTLKEVNAIMVKRHQETKPDDPAKDYRNVYTEIVKDLRTRSQSTSIHDQKRYHMIHLSKALIESAIQQNERLTGKLFGEEQRTKLLEAIANPDDELFTSELNRFREHPELQ